MSENAKKAFKIGSICFLSYLAVYIAKNVLGAVTPAMMSDGFSDSTIGVASSIYFYTYAIGQLINGAIGDKIKAKYMISLGLLFAGISNFLFAQINLHSESLGNMPFTAYIAYGAMGFFLAMIYGPMTKVVSENTEMPYTTRCSLGYTVASYLGTPTAGLLSAIFLWQNAFSASSIALVSMSVVFFFSFLAFEKKGIIAYGRFNTAKKESSKADIVKVLYKRQIIKFAIVSMITGIVRTSTVFWLTTYFAKRLLFSERTSSVIFSIATIGIATAAFIAVFVYEKLGHDLDKTLLIMFISASIFFILTYFISEPFVNIVLMILAIMSSNGAATMLWSRYCPGLRDTGYVSSATGFLDFLSYMASGTMNLVTPHIVGAINWNGMVLIWLALTLIGIVISLPRKKAI